MGLVSRWAPMACVLALAPSVANVIGSVDGECTPGAGARTALHLSEQLDAARVNAILVAVELRYDEATGDPGALVEIGRLRSLLDELLAALAPTLGRSLSVDDVDRVVLASHSGGYVAVAECLDHGGVAIDEVQLYDSLYGELATYRAWTAGAIERFDPGDASPRRFSVVYTDGGGTASNSRTLGAELEALVLAPSDILFDDSTATLAPEQFAVPMLVKHSMLTHDGVPKYYFERILGASGFAPRSG